MTKKSKKRSMLKSHDTASQKKHIKPPILFIIPIAVAIAIAVFANIDPNIKCTGSQVITISKTETKIPNLNAQRFEIKLQDVFMNHSIKNGYIDRLEFIPDSRLIMKDLVRSVDKTILTFHRKTTINFTVIFEIENIYRSDMTLPIKLRLYDNKGHDVTCNEGKIYELTIPMVPTS